MSVRTRMIRRMRKKVMRLGTVIQEGVINRDDDGTLWPKDQWGYEVHAMVNGYYIYSEDRDRYGAWKGALEAAEVSMEEPTFVWPSGWDEPQTEQGL